MTTLASTEVPKQSDNVEPSGSLEALVAPLSPIPGVVSVPKESSAPSTAAKEVIPTGAKPSALSSKPQAPTKLSRDPSQSETWNNATTTFSQRTS